jgi:mono/diheme cytochrome c family protein
MKLRCLSLFALVALVMIAGCTKAPETAKAPSTPAKAPEGHPLRGVIQAVQNDDRTLLVQHEEIPGVMPAMTMAFQVNATTLLAARKDQVITARMVQRGEAYWLDEVKVVESLGPAASPGPAPVAVAPAQAAAVPTPEAPAPAPAVAAALDLTAGRAAYTRVCLVCHQGNGQGIAPLFPPLAGSEWVISADPSNSIRIILHGLSGPIEVKGKRYSSAMPPQGGVLKDADIAAIVTYIRNSWGNQASPVSADDVAKLRAEHAGRTAMWTVAELPPPTP